MVGSNSFGKRFRLTTWGESHGPAIGCTVDGCPAGLELNCEVIQSELKRRRPGRAPYASPRNEPDIPEILSGVFEGRTTGAPITILIRNQDADSSKYELVKSLLKPGHANYTYLQKFGVFDYRGGGRASGRETTLRVAAGAVAKAFLSRNGITVAACLEKVGEHTISVEGFLRNPTKLSPDSFFCPSDESAVGVGLKLKQCAEMGDSLGAQVVFAIKNVPPGLGEPVYDKYEALLAHAMLSVPASKGFEIGSGFACTQMQGSDHNDPIELESGEVRMKSNRAGGVLGGISTGETIYGRVAFKPTSSITPPQKTVTIDGERATFSLPSGSRHDPCVGLRAVPVVEAMAALVTADLFLMNRMAKV